MRQAQGQRADGMRGSFHKGGDVLCCRKNVLARGAEDRQLRASAQRRGQTDKCGTGHAGEARPETVKSAVRKQRSCPQPSSAGRHASARHQEQPGPSREQSGSCGVRRCGRKKAGSRGRSKLVQQRRGQVCEPHPRGPQLVKPFTLSSSGVGRPQARRKRTSNQRHNGMAWYTQTYDAASDARTRLNAGPSGLKWTHHIFTAHTEPVLPPHPMSSPLTLCGSIDACACHRGSACALNSSAVSARLATTNVECMSPVFAQVQSSPPAASSGKS